MAHIRTIDRICEEIKAADPNTALTKTAIRRLVVTGQIPSVRAGSKYPVSSEALDAYLTGVLAEQEPAPGYGEIRPIDGWRR